MSPGPLQRILNSSIARSRDSAFALPDRSRRPETICAGAAGQWCRQCRCPGVSGGKSELRHTVLAREKNASGDRRRRPARAPVGAVAGSRVPIRTGGGRRARPTDCSCREPNAPVTAMISPARTSKSNGRLSARSCTWSRRRTGSPEGPARRSVKASPRSRPTICRIAAARSRGRRCSKTCRPLRNTTTRSASRRMSPMRCDM